MIGTIIFAILITAAAFACVFLLFVGLVGKVYDHEDGCNALCPPEMFKCSKHRESTDIPLKTDDPEEFYINPKFKNV